MLKHIFLSIALIFLLSTPVMAVGESLGVASMVPILNVKAVDGNLICNQMGKSELCNKDQDANLTGIVTTSPAAVFDTELNAPGFVPMVTSGKAFALVSTENGPIKIGDYITTSSKHPGIGVKAIKSGYVVGIATSDYTSTDKNSYGSVMLVIGIKPALLSNSASNNLFELMKQGLESAFMTPLSALRYLVAAILILASVFYAFYYFANVAKKGVEAVGRNPLASKAINLSVLMNIGFALLLVGTGLTISYLVMSL